MGGNGDFFQEKWEKWEIAQEKMGENGEKWGKCQKQFRGKWRNTLGRTCFQAFLQREVICDMTSLAFYTCAGPRPYQNGKVHEFS